MSNFQEILRLVMILFIWIVIIRIFMNFINNIGKRLGIGKFFVNLLKKVRNKFTRKM
ncbi:hypothetical protein GOQ29_11135 [Clostridium sp. D2Q-14]|uniref:hypothetical protein n=1 Tax=Anaeromonas gelatinilytica TaxID=2683194 RepID=UPI00193C656F|nr:hypothetical protein [Anaeromonas gelatinilytica]MBS4536169.1 hypothetical protein [Anaeromonas gelatinilytica]